MLIQVSHLPVIGEDGILIGFLSKEKLQLEMADLSRESMDWEFIPEDFIESNLPESFLSFFNHHSTITVLNRLGQKKESWDKSRILAEYSRSISKEKQISNGQMDSSEPANSLDKNTKEKSPSKDPIAWFMKLILESFADPLFSTDINGNSIFFNDRFEKEILSQAFFRNSVSFAERFLRDLNKDVFASFLKANELDMNSTQNNGKVLQTMLPKLGYMVRIVTLMENDKIVGYLYHFLEMKNRIASQSDSGIVFPSLEEAFANKLPLELVLQETESFYIYQSLLRNYRNVSHAANELGIPRSTLQNRIRQLELDKKFPEEAKDPIPRKRKIDKPKPKPKSTSKPKSKTVPKKKKPIEKKAAVKKS
ncbi:MAG: transcriptional regulator, partial [Leptospira sp.]|nr:transcriptional regulator [Leptospira sp.]